MKKLHIFGLGYLTRIVVLLVIGLSVSLSFTWDKWGDLSLFILLVVIFFGILILLIISNLAAVVSFINSNSSQEITSTEDIVHRIENQQEVPIEKEVKIEPYYSNHLIKSSLTNGKLNGDFQEFNENGFMVSRGKYLNGLRTGEWMFYTDEGDLLAIGNFKDGKKHGDWKILNVENKDGRYPDAPEFVLQESYINGIVSDGTWRYFHWDGSLKATGQIINGLRNGEWRGYPSKTEGAYTKAIFKNGVVYPTLIRGNSSNVFDVHVSNLKWSSESLEMFLLESYGDVDGFKLAKGLLNEGFVLFHFEGKSSSGFYRHCRLDSFKYDVFGEFKDWIKNGSWYYEEGRKVTYEYYEFGRQSTKLFGKIPIKLPFEKSSLEGSRDYYLEYAFDCFEFNLERYYSGN